MTFLKKRKLPILVFLGIIICLAASYFAYRHIHANTFYGKTIINGVDVSSQTVKQAQSALEAETTNGVFTILKGNEKVLTLHLSDDAETKLDAEDELKSIKKKQDTQNVFTLLFKKKVYGLESVSYNHKKIAKLLAGQSWVKDQSNPTRDAYVTYDQEKKAVTIVKEYYGTNYNAQDLTTKIIEAMRAGKTSINLTDKKYYVQPTIKSNNQELVKKKDALGNAVGATITLSSQGKQAVVDAQVYFNWMKYENGEVSLYKKRVKKYVESLKKTFNTYGKPISFTLPNGKTIKASGGTYGAIVNVDKEVKALSKDILEKKVVTRAINAKHYGNDTLGKTFILVSLANQRVTAYKNGKKILTSSVVTGNTSLGRGTTAGAYYIFYKSAPAVLRGFENGKQTYESHVDFWMPFHNGQGLHNAPWRGAFGGTIYRYNGSHGCVNMTYSAAQMIYKNFNVGTPVIVI